MASNILLRVQNSWRHV